MDIPLIVRLQGTKEQEAKKLIKESGMAIFPFDGLDEVRSLAPWCITLRHIVAHCGSH